MTEASKKHFIQNLAAAFLAQGVALALSFITSLIVPKLLGVAEFGYWQLFLFYITYVGFFHLGLNDGVYLINGGKTRREIDKADILSQFIVGTVAQTSIAVVTVVLSIAFLAGNQRTFVIICSAIYMVVHNAAGYLGYIFQALNETKLYSYSCVVNRLTFLCLLIALLVLKCTMFEPYVLAYCVSEVAALLYCCLHAAFLFKERPEKTVVCLCSVMASIRCGIKLMIANVASSLILGIVRFAVDYSWGIETFGEVSFALSLVNFFLVFVSQVSMVLFPALRKIQHDKLNGIFAQGQCLLSGLLPWAFVLYFPICHILSFWLPQYQNSLYYFALLLPVCLFDGKMNLLGMTFMKVLRKERLLLRINLAAVAASGLLVLLNLAFVRSIELMILGVVFVIVARSIVSETLVRNSLGMPFSKNAIWECLVVAMFITVIHLDIAWPGIIALAVLCSCCLFSNAVSFRESKA